MYSQPKPGNRRRIKSVLPSEYQSNTSINDDGIAEADPNATEEEQKRTKAFQMIQQKIQAAAAEKTPQFDEEDEDNYGVEKF